MKSSITNGVVGISATGGGLAVSLSTVNATLQTASLSIGLLVGCITLYRLLTHKPKTPQ